MTLRVWIANLERQALSCNLLCGRGET